MLIPPTQIFLVCSHTTKNLSKTMTAPQTRLTPHTTYC